jgi:hypothetical protein
VRHFLAENRAVRKPDAIDPPQPIALTYSQNRAHRALTRLAIEKRAGKRDFVWQVFDYKRLHVLLGALPTARAGRG